MAYLNLPKKPAEIKRMGVVNLRQEYLKVAESFQKILDEDVIRCSNCGEWLSRTNYYTSKLYRTGVHPVCKKCLIAKVEQRKNPDDKPNETKESVISVCQDLDIPYIDKLYNDCYKNSMEETSAKGYRSAFGYYVPIVFSLPQYKKLRFKDSELPQEILQENAQKTKIKQSTIKRFGQGFTDSDYQFLQDEYEDWVSKYECNTKAQSELFERLCFKKLEIHKATLAGKSTKDLDESYQRLMNTANITPRQNSLDALSEGQNFGQMIQKWEEDRPIPECDPELRDVDKIGLYVDVFFKGHMAKMLNLKNSLQDIYEKFMMKFTVTKPEYNEEDDSEELFDRIFSQNNEVDDG